MSESSEKLSGANPAELWMKWYESSSRMWTDALRGSREGQADPWGLYRQWTESMEEARKSITGAGGGAVGGPEAAKSVERMMSAMAPMASAGSMGGAMDPERMNKWLEEASRSWQKSAQVGSEMISAAPRWIQLMEQARDNMMNAEGGVPSDPLQFVVQWYNATSGPLSEFVQDLLERDEFLEPSSRFLESYARAYKIFSRSSEEYLSALQLPTRSDITRIATLIVALEDKVDRIEEAFEDFEYGYATPATAEEVQSLENRIDQLDRKLGKKLDEGATNASGYATAESVSSLDGRIDGVESKLDRLLTAVEALQATTTSNGSSEAAAVVEANGSATESTTRSASGTEEIQATDAARRKAQELNVNLAAVEGTGANGQITVDDVRKKGAS